LANEGWGTGASYFIFAENINDNMPIELMSSNAKHTGTPNPLVGPYLFF
jgi:hypothetical protein